MKGGIFMPEEAITEELREQVELARQFVLLPYAEVKKRLDKAVSETAKRITAEFAEKFAREAAA